MSADRVVPLRPTVVVVTGVSGSGKSTVGRLLAARLGWVFCDGDELHPAANVATMRAARPLSEADRGPWLDAVRAWVTARAAAEGAAVIACSALRRRYRDHLRYQDHLRDRDDPCAGDDAVWFLHLDPPPQVLAARLTARREHFMPATLLGSQLALLEPLAPDEPGVRVGGDALKETALAAAVQGLAADGRIRPGPGETTTHGPG